MPEVCLISMPFTPVNTPGLGISILKACLERSGIGCDVYYGTLDFIDDVLRDETPSAAMLDYNFIASMQQLGDVMFAPSLWNKSDEEAAAVMKELTRYRTSLLTPDKFKALGDRFCLYLTRIPTYLQHCLRARDWGAYRIIGFSSTFSQNVASLTFARMLRERYPNLHIVFGGANCDGEMGAQMMESFPWIDSIVQGEAEESFPSFVRDILDNSPAISAPGILLRSAAGVKNSGPAIPVADLDQLPYPNFDDYFAQLPATLRDPECRGELRLPIETSRGCWWGAVHHCIFCGLNPTTMAFRSKSPDRAVSEFRLLSYLYGSRQFTAVDNIISQHYFDTVLPQLEEDGFDIFYEVKANLKEEQVHQLYRAGVRNIQPGIEGLSSEILDLMKKGVRGYQNLELLKWCATYTVEPVWFYLYGFPSEPVEPYWREMKRMERFCHLPPPRNPNPVLIDRFSPLYSRRHEYGYTRLRPARFLSLCYQGLSESELMRIAYHFDVDAPNRAQPEYELALWEAVTKWQSSFTAGARLYQFHAARTTLIVDTRRGPLRAWVLTGAARDLYAELRTAQKATRLHPPGTDGREPDLQDIELSWLAAQLGAELLTGASESGDVTEFLSKLNREWLAECIDDRWLALAVDCCDPVEAERFGLQHFVRQADRPAPARPQPESSETELFRVLVS